MKLRGLPRSRMARVAAIPLLIVMSLLLGACAPDQQQISADIAELEKRGFTDVELVSGGTPLDSPTYSAYAGSCRLEMTKASPGYMLRTWHYGGIPDVDVPKLRTHAERNGVEQVCFPDPGM